MFLSRLDILGSVGVSQLYRTLRMNAFFRVRPLPTHRTCLVVSTINDWYWLLLAHEFSLGGGDSIIGTALVLGTAQMYVMDLNRIGITRSHH